MIKLLGILFLTFWLGYLTASNQLLTVIFSQKHVLYVMSSIASCYLFILVPLERIAEKETKKNPPNRILRTSAREQLQRRGSF
ncbi:hypothetical protein AB4K20DRAFT_1912202 [Rhizopus microsporus]